MKDCEKGLPRRGQESPYGFSESQAVSLGKNVTLHFRLAQCWYYSPRNAMPDAERHGLIMMSRLDYAEEQRAWMAEKDIDRVKRTFLSAISTANGENQGPLKWLPPDSLRTVWESKLLEFSTLPEEIVILSITVTGSPNVPVGRNAMSTL